MFIIVDLLDFLGTYELTEALVVSVVPGYHLFSFWEYLGDLIVLRQLELEEESHKATSKHLIRIPSVTNINVDLLDSYKVAYFKQLLVRFFYFGYEVLDHSLVLFDVNVPPRQAI